MEAKSIGNAIATATLGAVKRLVGLLQHILGPGEALTALGQTYTNRYRSASPSTRATSHVGLVEMFLAPAPAWDRDIEPLVT